jgi:cytochrome c553
MRPVLAALMMSAAAVVPAAADEPSEPLAACIACHGEHGQSATPEVPSLGAQNAAYTLIQLYLFREKQRNFAVMNTVAKGLNDDALRSLSDVIAKLPPPQPAEGADADRIERGRLLAERYHCSACHRNDLTGHENVPRIAAQREDYLLKTLHDYKSRARIGYDATMAEALVPVADEEIADLAYFVARQR